jgi:hypothetical protein
MDGYLMPIADLLIDAVAGYQIISFMMVMQVTIKYSWLKKIFTRLLSDVQVMWGCLSG